MTPTSKTLLPERRVEIHASAPARISMMGSRAWLIEAPGAFDLPAQRRIWSMAQNLQQWPAVESLIPGVTNLLVLLHDTPEEPTAVERRLHEYWLSAQALNLEGRQIDIPVCYGGEHATDLEAVCRHTGFSAREVIRRHSQGSIPWSRLAVRRGLAISMVWIRVWRRRVKRCLR
jgi:allophanate hydrolase subunit 1